MPVAIQIMGCAANYHLGGMEGWFIHHVDVQAAALSYEWLKLTPHIDDAWLWNSAEDAFATWKEILKSDPVRLDGKPNRPLTAFTIQIVRVEERNIK